MDNTQGKRRTFCRHYLRSGNVREAAMQAGCSPQTAEDDGLRMLESPYCRRYLSQLASQPALPVQSLVIAGLSRLAFGAANDAAALLFSDKPLTPDALAKLDLFGVTSIRRDRADDRTTVEIKFADRQRAMEKLLECAYSSDSSAAAAALLSALGGGEEVCDDLSDNADALFGQAENGSELVEPEGNPAP